MFLDCGSQKSHLTEQAKGKLASQPNGQQWLCMLHKRITQGTSDKIRVAGKRCPPMQLSLYAVPMIYESLVSQPISVCARENQHLASLDLSDYSEGEHS